MPEVAPVTNTIDGEGMADSYRGSVVQSVSMTGADGSIPDPQGGPPIPAYAALPERAARGVVVLHEIYGRQPEIDRVVETFADRGYAAVEPDLFHDGRLRCIRQMMTVVRSGRGPKVDEVRRVRAWLCERS